MDPKVNLTPLIIGDNSSSTQPPNEDGGEWRRRRVEPPLSPALLSPTFSVIFTASEMDEIIDTLITELTASYLKADKRKLANRELESQVVALKTENDILHTNYNHLQSAHAEMDYQLRELSIHHQGTVQQVHLHQALNDQHVARINELTRELNQYRREAVEGSNMPQFQQCNIDELHQPQINPGFDFNCDEQI